MSGDRYQEVVPPPALRPFVRMIWTYEAAEPTGDVQRIAPDGCPELILHAAEPYEEQAPDGSWRTQPRTLFAGQLTRPLALRPTGPVDLIAVRFEPDGARDWFGRPMTEATDRALDASGLVLDLERPDDRAARLAAILRWLEDRSRSWRIDPLVRDRIDAAAAALPLPSISPTERRALQRRFRDRVGAPLQTLSSVFRFRRIFDHAAHVGEVVDREAGDWLRAGLEAGYFDQPQMARDFRRFLGCTATEWARGQMALARRIASQSYKPEADAPG